MQDVYERRSRAARAPLSQTNGERRKWKSSVNCCRFLAEVFAVFIWKLFELHANLRRRVCYVSCGESPSISWGPQRHARHCFARVIKSTRRDRKFLDVPSSGLINYPYPFLASLAEKWIVAWRGTTPRRERLLLSPSVFCRIFLLRNYAINFLNVIVAHGKSL